MTTRAVALAAGVQAPTIYRLLGDKNGLLDAVAEHGFASYLARKPPVAADADPVESLHAGWELHVGFGLANPELFRLMYTTPRPAGPGRRRDRHRDPAGPVRRVAEAGRLRAALPDLTALTAVERALLGDWLERIADSQHGPGISSLPPKDSGTVDE